MWKAFREGTPHVGKSLKSAAKEPAKGATGISFLLGLVLEIPSIVQWSFHHQSMSTFSIQPEVMRFSMACSGWEWCFFWCFILWYKREFPAESTKKPLFYSLKVLAFPMKMLRCHLIFSTFQSPGVLSPIQEFVNCMLLAPCLLVILQVFSGLTVSSSSYLWAMQGSSV